MGKSYSIFDKDYIVLRDINIDTFFFDLVFIVFIPLPFSPLVPSPTPSNLIHSNIIISSPSAWCQLQSFPVSRIQD